MTNVNQLKADRHALKVMAEAMCEGAISSKTDLAGEKLDEYNVLLSSMKRIDEALEQHAAGATFGTPHDGSPDLNAMVGRTAQGHQKAAVSNVLRVALQHATAEQREEVQNLAAYLSGNISAAADLKPSGDGGFIIPSMVQEVLERNYSQFAPVVSVARIWATETGEDATFPVLSDSEEAVQVDCAEATGADDTVSGDTPPTDLTGPKLGAYKVSSKPVFLPRETITDSPIDIVQEVIGALLARVIRFENLKYTSGSGVGEAEGFLANCAVHTSSVALDLDTALDLSYAVPALYRSQGVYMCSDTTAKYLRKIKTGISGDKQQLWADADATKGTPPTLHSYPVYINPAMSDVAANGTFAGVSPLAFGNFQKFVVRKAEQGQPYIYRYPVPARDGSAVILFRRSDSKLLIPEAIVRLVASGS